MEVRVWNRRLQGKTLGKGRFGCAPCRRMGFVLFHSRLQDCGEHSVVLHWDSGGDIRFQHASDLVSLDMRLDTFSMQTIVNSYRQCDYLLRAV